MIFLLHFHCNRFSELHQAIWSVSEYFVALHDLCSTVIPFRPADPGVRFQIGSSENVLQQPPCLRYTQSPMLPEHPEIKVNRTVSNTATFASDIAEHIRYSRRNPVSSFQSSREFIRFFDQVDFFSVQFRPFRNNICYFLCATGWAKKYIIKFVNLIL